MQNKGRSRGASYKAVDKTEMREDDHLYQAVIQKSRQLLDSGHILEVELERICLCFHFAVESNQGFWKNMEE